MLVSSVCYLSFCSEGSGPGEESSLGPEGRWCTWRNTLLHLAATQGKRHDGVISSTLGGAPITLGTEYFINGHHMEYGITEEIHHKAAPAGTLCSRQPGKRGGAITFNSSLTGHKSGINKCSVGRYLQPQRNGASSSLWGQLWRGQLWRGQVWRGQVWRGQVWRGQPPTSSFTQTANTSTFSQKTNKTTSQESQ